MGKLQAVSVKGREVFSFHYEPEWLNSSFALVLDPDLGLYTGPQYTRDDKPNFGLFTDSSPDRWGRVLMKRREAFEARQENRKAKTLLESDYLLGVYDIYRMGAIRYKLKPDGPFIDDNDGMAAPPMTSLRKLEAASLELEADESANNPHFSEWMKLLLAPGSSLGGARPKASVIDKSGQLWIAKFPSQSDEGNNGAWEEVLNRLAKTADINVAEGYAKRFTRRQHTYLTKRFDRDPSGTRTHFASAMTLLGYQDGDNATTGASYLEIAEFIMRSGATPNQDLEELWKRIVFSICVSNTDDHLRNHGFLLTSKGWILSPAYDLNPIPSANGLSLNISENDNTLDLDLARSVASEFRINNKKSISLIEQIKKAVACWQTEGAKIGITREEIQTMESAFSNAEE
jgi:serine/threonine-protein kinase HipA